MKQRIVVINYGMGNLGSIKRKFSLIGSDVDITADLSTIMNADKIILPGVGHFKKAVNNLRDLNLWDVLNECVLIHKKPILGICLGMQLMAKHSSEGDVNGFGWFDADVVRFPQSADYKVPHMGWNQIEIVKNSNLMKDVPNLSEFYFVHSYHFLCGVQSDILNETEYGYKFTSAVEKGNIFGMQYHPEKSHDIGELVLKNYLEL